MEKTLNPVTKNKPVGVILLIMALIGFAIVIYRIAGYQYEFDAQFTPVDYGRFNVLTYFTIQSNFACCCYFLTVALAIFGVKKVEIIAFNPVVKVYITLYVIVAGVTYNMGFPLKMTQAWTFDTFYHAFISFLQIYFHICMPIAVIALLFFPFTNQKVSKKAVLLSGVYPFVYSIVSMVRGALFKPTYYPYPFYNPEFIWQTFMKDKPMNFLGAYGLIAILLVFGISLFITICAIITLIHNKRAAKTEKQTLNI